MRLLWPCCAELEELAVVWIQPFEKFSLDHGQMSLNQVKRGFNRMDEYVCSDGATTIPESFDRCLTQ